MINHTDRGVKRRCQNEACGLPFYDLNRVTFSCPTCGTPYQVHAPSQAALPAQEKRSQRRQILSRRHHSTVSPDESPPSAAALASHPEATAFDEPEGSHDAAAILELDDDDDVDADLIPDRESGDEA